MRGFPVVLLLAVWIPVPVIARGQTPADAQQQVQIRRLLVDYRGARNDTGRRVRAIRAIVELGPGGVETAGGFLESEIDRLGRTVAGPPPTAALDERIEELRKILADLRADPDLSKEQTQTVGLPALDELTVLWQRREVVLNTHFGKLGRVREQLSLVVDFLKQFQAEAAASPLNVSSHLDRAAQLLLRASKPEDPEVKRVLEENAKLATMIDPREVAGMQALDAMRIMCGLRPLLYDVKLCEAARGHSADMEAKGFFSHDSPVPGKATPWDRAKLADTTASGENIYMGSGSPVAALKGWFLSPGHHKNMLSDSNTRQGLGRVGKHWTQLFGR